MRVEVRGEGGGVWKFVVQSKNYGAGAKHGCVLCDTVIVAGVLGYIIPHVGLNSLPWQFNLSVLLSER